MSTVPNPTVMQRFAPKAVFQPPIVADLDPQDPGKIVRPGLREQIVETEHDGVVKAKHLKKGQVVRAYLHGQPRGSERTVESIERLDDGGTVRVTFSSAHPVTDYKAAYRFYDASLAGTTVRHANKVPALVAYEEV